MNKYKKNISFGRDTNLGLADVKPLFFGQVQNFVVDPFLNKACFSRVCSTSLLKALWEKEKLFVTSSLSFFLSVFFSFGELFAVYIKSKLPSGNSFSLEESKICCLGKG